MEKLKIIVFSFTLLSLVRCAAQNSERFYKAVVENDENTPKEHFPDSSIYFGKKELGEPDKKIFDLLNEQLKNVNHIYYGYLPKTTTTGSLLGFVIEVFVYDVDNNKIYFLQQKNELSKKIFFFEPSMEDYRDDIDYYNYIYNFYAYRADFIIKYIRNNDCNSIQENAEGNYNQIGQVVYDINLKENTVNRCSFNYLYLFKEYIKSIKKN